MRLQQSSKYAAAPVVDSDDEKPLLENTTSDSAAAAARKTKICWMSGRSSAHEPIFSTHTLILGVGVVLIIIASPEDIL